MIGAADPGGHLGRRAARRAGLAAVGFAVLVAVAGWCGGTAAAHAELVRSTPANGEVLEEPPAEILVEFTEAVDPIEPAIRLVDAQGNDVAIGDVDQDAGADTVRAVVPSDLADGTYVVAWQTLSADSHRVRGSFTFSVGEATATAPGLVEGLFDAEPDGSTGDVALGIGRFASYAGLAVFVGLLCIGTLLAPAVVESRRGLIVLSAALAAAVTGTVVMIATQAHLIAGSLVAWIDVIETQSGRWWYARLVAAIVLALLLLAWRRIPQRVRPVTAVVVGVATMALVAAGGHGITGDAVATGYLATVAHLVAMAVWIGGLTLIVLAAGERLAVAARVSPWALAAIVTLAVTGSINAWRQLGTFSALTSSAYGRWLVVKLVLVVVVVVVAAVVRRFVRRSTAPSATVLGRAVGVELAGIALVLMATAGLVNTAPPDEAPELGSASAVVGERIAQIELDPAVTGGTEMHVYITSPSGGLDRADEISVEAELASAGIGPLLLETQPAGPNHVIGPNVVLPVPGEWTFVVRARYGDFDQVVFTMEIPVDD